jgi:peptidoglycan hydrolase-like protein with peptidoglycan-binding domain
VHREQNVHQERSVQQRSVQTRPEGRVTEGRAHEAVSQFKERAGRTTGRAEVTPRRQENAGPTHQVSESEHKGKISQDERQIRGAQNSKNLKEPAQTTGLANRGNHENEQTRSRSTERVQQNLPNGGRQNAQRENRGGRVMLSEEQRTRVERQVLTNRDIPHVDRLNFSVSVGVVVPVRVRVVAVPLVLIDIDPEWRGDDCFVANDEIIIVDHSRRIVAVVPVGSSTVGLGDDDVDIRAVQEVLIERGFFHGRVDGVIGRDTIDALIRFQRREGIAVTGHIDVRTTKALGISGRGAQNQGRGRFEQRQGQSELSRTTTEPGGTRELKGGQDRHRQTEGSRLSTSGQGPSTQLHSAPNETRANERRRCNPVCSASRAQLRGWALFDLRGFGPPRPAGHCRPRNVSAGRCVALPCAALIVHDALGEMGYVGPTAAQIRTTQLTLLGNGAALLRGDDRVDRLRLSRCAHCSGIGDGRYGWTSPCTILAAEKPALALRRDRVAGLATTGILVRRAARGWVRSA